MPYDTIKTTATATNGSTLTLVVPMLIPTQERAGVLRQLYTRLVRHPGGHWKGRAEAVVAPHLADDVADAMGFMGSIVDVRETLPDGSIRLYSEGYWAQIGRAHV